MKILSFYHLKKNFIINSLFKPKIALIRQKIERRLSMDIYKPINKHFFENKKIKISFSKALNKKERYFLKFLFTEYKLLEKLEKTTVLSDIELTEIMKVLKFKSFQQLKKFLDNLQLKKLEFFIFSNDNTVIYGRFPVCLIALFIQRLNFSLQENCRLQEKIILFFHYLGLIL